MVLTYVYQLVVNLNLNTFIIKWPVPVVDDPVAAEGASSRSFFLRQAVYTRIAPIGGPLHLTTTAYSALHDKSRLKQVDNVCLQCLPLACCSRQQLVSVGSLLPS